MAQAGAASEPSLVISQLKITSKNGQFITLYNSTDSLLDMSQYQLEYFNNYDPDKVTSSRVISLSGFVQPHGYFMVNNSSLVICYQMTVDSLSLGFSSTAGMVRVLDTGLLGTSAPSVEDYVGWSKTAAAGAQTLPTDSNAFLERQPLDAAGYPDIRSPGTGNWTAVEPGNDACQLINSTDGSVVDAGPSQLLPAVEPAATILSLNGGYADVSPANLPLADSGLITPAITELLPNPAGSGNDTTDEFVELYNPNNASFDLSGFSLQTGTTSLHNYKFPVGTSLPASGFAVFYSADTGLSLSNQGGQARLLDPSGKPISISGIYGSAGDGLAWALANGKWYWTVRPTPTAANIIDQPASKKPAAKTDPKRPAAAPKASKTTKPKTAKAAKAKKPKKAKSNLTAKPVAAKQVATSIHPWTLALVAAAAILYGAYEYRADLANSIYRLRSYFRARREDRT